MSRAAALKPNGAGVGSVIAMLAISAVVAIPAAIAWTVVFVRDDGRRAIHWAGRKVGTSWAQ